VKTLTDKDRLDWLADNLFHREKDEWDQRFQADSDMWVFFAPKNQGADVRRMIDNAIMRQEAANA